MKTRFSGGVCNILCYYIPGVMKTRPEKSVLGLFDHIPWGLSKLKTGPRNRKKKDKQCERVNKRKLTFLFISSTLARKKKRLRRILHEVVKLALTRFSKIHIVNLVRWLHFP